MLILVRFGIFFSRYELFFLERYKVVYDNNFFIRYKRIQKDIIIVTEVSKFYGVNLIEMSINVKYFNKHANVYLKKMVIIETNSIILVKNDKQTQLNIFLQHIKKGWITLLYSFSFVSNKNQRFFKFNVHMLNHFVLIGVERGFH